MKKKKTNISTKKIKLTDLSRKKVLLMGLVSLFVIVLISIGTYAIWNSEMLTGDNTIKSGQVKMSYTEINEITMENALPMKDEEGKVLEKYFDFQVLSYIKTRVNDSTQRQLNYKVILEPMIVENPLDDNEIKVYLTKVENGNETEVVEPTTIDKLTDYILKSQDEIFSNNKGEVITSYRLRAWIDESVDTSKFNENKYRYKFRVNVNSGAIEETVKDELAFIDEADTSGANTPKLTSNMIPVYYDMKTDVWRKADTSNKKSNWYNYDKKKWANAVTVSDFSTTYKSVLSSTNYTGSIVSEIGSYKEVSKSSVSVSQNYKNGSTYYYSCCQSSKPTLNTARGYYQMSSGTWTRNDSINGKYCYLNTYTAVTGSCTNYVSSKIYYMSTRGSTTTSGNYSGYNWTTAEYAATPVYTSKDYKISSTYTFDTSTGKYTLTDPISETYSTSHVGYYLCEDKTSTTCDTMFKIKEVNNDTKTITKSEVYEKEQVINSTSSSDYEVGDEIPMDKISTMWVWIPRYTYTYLNTNTPQSINIKFENGTATTGTIKCTDNVSGSGTTSETCTDSKNGSLKAGTSTYTHPAFNFGGTQLTGIWVGKFENSAITVSSYESNTDSTIIIKPNVNSMNNEKVSYMFKDVRQMEKANNVYGFSQSSSTTFNWNGNLTGDSNNLDTHMMKNTEWGAAIYLSHSKYGINKEINFNNSIYYTGRSGGNVGGSTQINTVYEDQESTVPYTQYGFYTYDGYLLNYNTNTKSRTRDMSKVASTTGNIYGIYDMSGGANEYMMGNIADSSGQFQVSGAGNWTTSSTPLAKYYDGYTYNISITTYTRGKLGDATKEMAPTGEYGNWYGDISSFPLTTNSWFYRGGYFGDGARAGAFLFRHNGGGVGGSYSSRSVLNILN